MRNESSGIEVFSWVGANVLDCLITGHRSADTQWTALPLPPLWLLVAAGTLANPCKSQSAKCLPHLPPPSGQQEIEPRWKMWPQILLANLGTASKIFWFDVGAGGKALD